MTAINLVLLAATIAIVLEIWEREKLAATAFFHRLTRRWRQRRRSREGWL